MLLLYCLFFPFHKSQESFNESHPLTICQNNFADYADSYADADAEQMSIYEHINRWTDADADADADADEDSDADVDA